MTYLDGSFDGYAAGQQAIAQQLMGTARPTVVAYRETYAWQLVKHAALLGVVAAAVMFVFAGGRSPLVSITYAASSLVFLAIVALLDRHRFESATPASAPRATTVAVAGHARTWQVPATVVRPSAVTQQLPIAYDLTAAFTGPVEVT